MGANISDAVQMQTQTSILSTIRTHASGVIVAVIIVLVAFIIGRLAGKLVKRALHEFELNIVFRRASGTRINIESFISTLITYFCYFVGVVMALNKLGITTTLLYMIGGAIIVIIVLSVILGVKDFIPNMIAGIIIAKKKFIRVGDVIRFNDMKVKIIEINFLESKMETKDGDILYVPNSELTQQKIIKVKDKD